MNDGRLRGCAGANWDSGAPSASHCTNTGDSSRDAPQGAYPYGWYARCCDWADGKCTPKITATITTTTATVASVATDSRPTTVETSTVAPAGTATTATSTTTVPARKVNSQSSNAAGIVNDDDGVGEADNKIFSSSANDDTGDDDGALSELSGSLKKNGSGAAVIVAAVVVAIALIAAAVFVIRKRSQHQSDQRRRRAATLELAPVNSFGMVENPLRNRSARGQGSTGGVTAAGAQDPLYLQPVAENPEYNTSECTSGSNAASAEYETAVANNPCYSSGQSSAPSLGEYAAAASTGKEHTYVEVDETGFGSSPRSTDYEYAYMLDAGHNQYRTAADVRNPANTTRTSTGSVSVQQRSSTTGASVVYAVPTDSRAGVYVDDGFYEAGAPGAASSSIVYAVPANDSAGAGRDEEV